jgi:outer membrane protein
MGKKGLFLFFFIFFATSATFGQKFGYIDSEYILGKMPEYSEAQQEIKRVSQAWQDEANDKKKQIESLYTALQTEEVLLTESMKRERQAEILRKEDELKEFQTKVFGYEGMFFLKQKELLEPVQAKVFEAVEAVASKQKLQIVFDKSGELVMIYTNPVHDYTDYVLEELGLGDKEDTVR